MAGFDPDKFLAETAPPKAAPGAPAPSGGGQAFDPDKFLAETAPASALPKPQKTSGGEALMRGAAQGATLGFADEATAGIGGLKDYVSGKLGLRGDIDLADAYRSYLKHIREADKTAEEEHPVAYGLGEGAGGLATAVIPGGALLNPVGKATLGARLATGATAGAISGLGKTEHDPTKSMDELEGFAGDIGKGALIGGLTQGAIEAATPLLKKAVSAGSEALENVAERRAFKAAVGNQSKVYDEAVKQGRVNDIGRELLDSGAVGFGDKARTIAENAAEAKTHAGHEIETILTAIDNRAPDLVDGRQIAANLRTYAGRIGGEGNAATVQKLNAMADAYEQRGAMSLSAAQVEKNSFKYRHGDPGATFDKEATNKIKSIIGDEMEEAVGRFDALVKAEPKAAQAVQTGSGQATSVPLEGTPVLKDAESADALRQAYEGAKSRYGAMATAWKAATQLANRQEKNATFGLLPTLAGLGGVAFGASHASPVMAIAGPAAAIAAKIARERGSSALAVGADKAANILAASPEVVAPLAAPFLQGNAPAAATQILLAPETQKKLDAIGRRIGQ